ncbi:UNVERIFIED_CONTAM: hypothetical protein HDU68_009175 [Siphonaria sp. JEL0065]|nr:hypothetical protein HDU68_009175 [Siphonaria sp. JEL0065]
MIIKLVMLVVQMALVVPVQTLYGYIASGDEGTKQHFAHVGFVGGFLMRMLKAPRAVGFVEDSLVSRALMAGAGRLSAFKLRNAVADTSRGIWFNNNPRNHVLLVIHGGGFVSGTPWQVVPHSLEIAKEYEAIAHKPLAVLAIKYPLCPEYSFKHILDTCLDAYNHLLDLGYTKISISGDSAGAHAALNLISCLKQEHPHLIQPYSAIAYCPWVDPFVSVLPTSFGASYDVSRFDFLSIDGSRYMASRVASTLDRGSVDNVSLNHDDLQKKLVPLLWEEDENLLSCIPDAGGLFVLYGGGETLTGVIDAFVDKLDASVSRTCAAPDSSYTSKVVKRSRHPYMPHDFNFLFFDSIGPGKVAAIKAIRESAEFLAN